jgi:hypothetical protein
LHTAWTVVTTGAKIAEMIARTAERIVAIVVSRRFVHRCLPDG